jgi:hypothetical protein
LRVWQARGLELRLALDTIDGASGDDARDAFAEYLDGPEPAIESAIWMIRIACR